MLGFAQFSVNAVGLVVLFPLIGALINGLYSFSGVRQVRFYIHWIACGSVFLSLLLTCGTFVHLLQLPETARLITVSLWPWIHIGSVQADVAFMIDP
ncbi:MAG: hypothetical protein ACYSWP_21225, partial [Planctomycetota bacterium]